MNHYEVLGLPSPATTTRQHFTPATLKDAYRSALLQHHPDKSGSAAIGLTSPPASASASPSRSAGSEAQSRPSVDAIRTAYAVLADPVARAEHDRQLLVERRGDGGSGAAGAFRTGGEVVDLDELQCDEGVEGVWYRACRCGERKGFMVTEEQLEDVCAKGGREIVVGCVGCSLWLRVAFGVVDDEGKG